MRVYKYFYLKWARQKVVSGKMLVGKDSACMRQVEVGMECVN
jgi:hypothetical protein